MVWACFSYNSPVSLVLIDGTQNVHRYSETQEQYILLYAPSTFGES